MFKNMKIGWRMGSGFAVLLALMVAMIVVSLNQMGATQEILDRIVKVNNVRLQLANEMIDDARETALAVRTFLLGKYSNQPSESIQKMRDDLAEYRRCYNEDSIKLKELIPEEDTKALDLFSKMMASGDASRQLQDQVIELAVAGKPEDGTNLMIAKVYPMVKQWINDLDDMVHHNEGRTAMRVDEAEKAHASTRTTIFALGVGAIALAVAIAIFLTLGITRPLGQGVQMMQEMAQGHLGMRLNMNRRDEIGTLANAMDRFSDDLQNVVVGAMRKIGEGDLSVEVVPKDSQDEIAPALKATVDSLRGLVDEATTLTKAAVEGKLSTRSNAARFKGAYRGIVQGVNDTLDAVIGPLNVAAAYVERISKGDIPQPITSKYSGDFEAFANNLNNMIQYLQEIVAAAVRMADGDFTAQIKAKSDVDQLGKALEAMVVSNAGIIRKIREGVNTLSAASNQILALTTQLATSSTETATAIAETTTTMEEIKQTSSQMSKRAAAVSEVAKSTAQSTETGRRSVEDTIAGMEKIKEQMDYVASNIAKLSEQSQAIGMITSTVNDLANQSKLLAVNASIEAAKAGEMGKGFAVVAQEVRSLAEQSKEATNQVRIILNDIQKGISGAVMATDQSAKAVEAGLKQSRTSGDVIGKIAEDIVTAAQAATQVAISTNEQMAGIDQVSSAMGNMKKATEQIVSSTRQSEESSTNLHELGMKLKQLVELYKT